MNLYLGLQFVVGVWCLLIAAVCDTNGFLYTLLVKVGGLVLGVALLFYAVAQFNGWPI